MYDKDSNLTGFCLATKDLKLFDYKWDTYEEACAALSGYTNKKELIVATIYKGGFIRKYSSK